MKKTFVVTISLASAFLLTGCGGGAQNQDYNGDGPGSADTQTSAAQDDKNACDLASDTALAALTGASDSGPARAAWSFKGNGGWYLAAPLGASAETDTVGLFATDADPSDTDFDGTIYALNDDAKSATSFNTAAPGSFDSDSSAAKTALGCVTNGAQ